MILWSSCHCFWSRFIWSRIEIVVFTSGNLIGLYLVIRCPYLYVRYIFGIVDINLQWYFGALWIWRDTFRYYFITFTCKVMAPLYSLIVAKVTCLLLCQTKSTSCERWIHKSIWWTMSLAIFLTKFFFFYCTPSTYLRFSEWN
jgi:hypothetical protein